MNKHIKRWLNSYIQPIVDEQIESRLAVEGENITAMAENAVESALHDARIDRTVESEIEDAICNLNLDDMAEKAIEDCDIDRIIEDKVSEEVTDEINNHDFTGIFDDTDVETSMGKAMMRLLSGMEFVTADGTVLSLRVQVKEEEKS